MDCPQAWTNSRWGELAKGLPSQAFLWPSCVDHKERLLSQVRDSKIQFPILATYKEWQGKRKQSNQTINTNSYVASHQSLPTRMLTLGVSDGLMRRGDLNMRNFQELSMDSRFLSTRCFESERELCPNKPRFSAHSLQQRVNWVIGGTIRFVRGYLEVCRVHCGIYPDKSVRVLERSGTRVPFRYQRVE